jgi:hypothetical protein
MRRRKSAAVERELRAIRRAIAKIEASFEGVPQFMRRMLTGRPASGALRKVRASAK